MTNKTSCVRSQSFERFMKYNESKERIQGVSKNSRHRAIIFEVEISRLDQIYL